MKKRPRDTADDSSGSSKQADKLSSLRYHNVERIATEDDLLAARTEQEMERANRFLDHIRTDPFIALIVTKEEGVKIFARKDVDQSVLQELREALGEMIEGRS